MRSTLIGLLMALGVASTSHAAVNVSISVNIPSYPRLVAVPGYPVYYAPGLNTNYFFYDGLYWVFEGDRWLASSWYNGPWRVVGPDYVPVHLWQVPVRYYRRPPAYFHAWHRDASPRWNEHWGSGWSARHEGWDRRDHRARVAPAPLPTYQREYSGKRYPQADQQVQLHARNYRYEPREQGIREHYKAEGLAQRSEAGPGQGKGKGKGHGEGEGQGQGKGHGKGHDR
jgi:hypothetical protein